MGMLSETGYDSAGGQIRGYVFYCNDCDKQFTLKRNSPKWLRDYYLQLMADD